LEPPEQSPPRTRSKLPTFIRGRVLANRFFVDEVFEVTPQSTFLRAHDLELDRVVLVRLKPRVGLVEPPRERARGWFKRLEHPLSSAGILGTLGVGLLYGGWPLLVCQYWRGRSLEAFLRSGEAPNLLSLLQIARQVALALEDAHRLGQVHGDLCSDDVWLSRQADGEERAMILGFQPSGSTDQRAAVLARDLSALGDLLSLIVASLLPSYRAATRRGVFGSHGRDSGALIVTVRPLTRVAAGCHGGSSGGRYRTAAEVASALERVESIATKLSGEQ
jgi:hypothetical protein